MAEYIEREREALFHRTKAFSANVIFRGCEEMVSPKDSCNPREWTKGYEHGMKESLNLIATQGAADVVPVVRCKDCKHRGDHEVCPLHDIRLCFDGDWHMDQVEDDKTEDEFFCAYGERKEAEDDV